MSGETQVVVGGQQNDRTSRELDGWPSRRAECMEAPGQRLGIQLLEAAMKHEGFSLAMRRSKLVGRIRMSYVDKVNQSLV